MPPSATKTNPALRKKPHSLQSAKKDPLEVRISKSVKLEEWQKEMRFNRAQKGMTILKISQKRKRTGGASSLQDGAYSYRRIRGSQ